MKRNSVVKIAGAVILASLLIISQNCWAQITPSTASTPFTPPFRTYRLQLSPDRVWVIVINTISEIQLDINSEDASRLFLIAIGKPYSVRVGLGSKQERKQVIVELQQKGQDIYDCYIKIEVHELWTVNKNWTKTTDDVDVTDILTQLGRILNEKLKPHVKRSE